MFPKRGCALYAKLRSIHHFKGLNDGCVLHTGASYIYTREITVSITVVLPVCILTVLSWHCSRTFINRVSIQSYILVSF